MTPRVRPPAAPTLARRHLTYVPNITAGRPAPREVLPVTDVDPLDTSPVNDLMTDRARGRRRRSGPPSGSSLTLCGGVRCRSKASEISSGAHRWSRLQIQHLTQRGWTAALRSVLGRHPEPAVAKHRRRKGHLQAPRHGRGMLHPGCRVVGRCQVEEMALRLPRGSVGTSARRPSPPVQGTELRRRRWSRSVTT